MWSWLPPLEKEWAPFWAAIIALAGVSLTAVNAWAVAWFNARATRQLAIDSAHRDLRKKLAAKALMLLHKLRYAARDMHEALASGNLGNAHELEQEGPTLLVKWNSDLRKRGEDWTVTDELLTTSFSRAMAAAAELLAIATESIARIEGIPPDQRKDNDGIVKLFEDMESRSARLDKLVDAAELAAEAYIFNIPAIRREARKRLKAIEGTR